MTFGIFHSIQSESSSKFSSSLVKSTFPKISVCSMPNLCSVYKIWDILRGGLKGGNAFLLEKNTAAILLIINSENVGKRVTHVGVRQPISFTKIWLLVFTILVPGKE